MKGEKRNQMKKGFSLLIVMIMVMSLQPLAVWAEDSENSEASGSSSQNISAGLTDNSQMLNIEDGNIGNADNTAIATDQVIVADPSLAQTEENTISTSMNMSEFEQKLNQFQAAYGYYNGSTYRDSDFNLAWQCHGYARLLTKYVFGVECSNGYAAGWSRHKNINQLAPGDLVRYSNDGHTVFVTAVSGDSVTITDANVPYNTNRIRWGVSTTKAHLNATLTYIAHYNANPVVSILPFRSVLDTLKQGDVISTGNFLLQGWALHQNSIGRMTYSINDGPEKEMGRCDRVDVNNAFPSYRNSQPGFNHYVDTDELNVGSNIVTLYAHTTDGAMQIARVGVVRTLLPLKYSLEFENGTVYSGNEAVLQGWALHGSGILKLTYSIDGGPEIESTLFKRQDVDKAFQDYQGANSGFKIRIDLGKYKAGSHQVDLKVYAGTGKVYSLLSRTVSFSESSEPIKTIAKNGKIYTIYNQSMTWSQAKNKAENMGGQLMSITSAGETAIAYELTQVAGRKVYWLGGTDEEKEGTWKWLSGEVFSYTNWGPGEPNNANGENCLGVINDSNMHWNDFPGHVIEGGFIVEKRSSIVNSNFVAFLGKDEQNNYYEYNADELNKSYLAYQIKADLASAKMYRQFLTSQCQVVGLKDQAKGYMDYTAAAKASLRAQMKGEAFDINSYFAGSDAMLLEETVGNVKIVDKDGNIQ